MPVSSRRKPIPTEYRGYKSIMLDLVCRAFGLRAKDIRKIHYHGRNKVMTISLEHDKDRCECHRDRDITINEKECKLRRWCGNATCAAETYHIEMGDSPPILTPMESSVPKIRPVRKDECKDIVMLEKSTWELARWLSRYFNSDLFYDSHRWWYYQYDSHRWKWDKSSGICHVRLMNIIHEQYDKYLDGPNSEVVKVFLKSVNRRKMRDDLVKDLSIHLHHPEFASKLDQNDNLIVCNNGVYDLDERLFRDGIPSDMSTLTTGREFLADYTSTSNHTSSPCIRLVEQALHFISDVLGDESVVHTVLASLCLSMHGKSSLQKFFMWVGCGSNGKSKLASLFRTCLGEYACTIPVTLFTQKRSESGRPCPELQRTKGRRVVFISEPSHNENLNLGVVKEVTGGDSMFTRGLYEAGGEIQCKFTPMLLCNVLPNVTDTSHGAWRRLVSVHFPTTFTDRVLNPHEKQLDPSIDTKIQGWADAFLTYMLTDGFPFYTGRGLAIPSSIQTSTEEYRAECDFYTEFFREKIVASPQVATDRVSWAHVWSTFYLWFKDSIGLEHLPKKVEVRKMLEKEHFKKKLQNGYWQGFICP